MEVEVEFAACCQASGLHLLCICRAVKRSGILALPRTAHHPKILYTKFRVIALDRTDGVCEDCSCNIDPTKVKKLKKPFAERFSSSLSKTRT